MKAKSTKDSAPRGGSKGNFHAPSPKGGQQGPKGGTGSESKKHPGSPKHGGQLFHGSS